MKPKPHLRNRSHEGTSGQGPLVLVGQDSQGYFKTLVPKGGHFTIGPGAAGMSFALRVYKDRTKSSMVVFNPGIQWVRDESVQMTRPIDSPEKLVSVLFELASIALTPSPEEEKGLYGGIGQPILSSPPSPMAWRPSMPRSKRIR